LIELWYSEPILQGNPDIIVNLTGGLLILTLGFCLACGGILQ